MEPQDLNDYLKFDLNGISSWTDLEEQIKTFDMTGTSLPTLYKDGFWLHGTGTLGVELATKCLSAGLPVLGFTDNSVKNQGVEILGLPVKAPGDVTDHVVICVYKYLQYEPLISTKYPQGCSSYAHLLLAFPEALLPHWCLVAPSNAFFENHSREYKALIERISNPIHKIEFMKQIATRSFLGILTSDQSDPSNREYLGGTLAERHGLEIILDIGAFDGDTAIRFCEYFENRDIQVIAVEPDQENFRKLMINSSRYPGLIKPLNLLLGNEIGLFPFFGDGSKASNIYGDANQLIPGMKVDDLFEKVRFTRIKMDVEGFEKVVLDGSLKTISSLSTSWTISTYHKPEDLLEIPQYFGEDYDLEVFSHSGRPWDTAYSFIPR